MGLALALAVHALLLSGILWLAARRPSVEPAPIPIDFLIETDEGPDR